MEHLLNQVRAPIDAFEVTLINAFSTLKSVQAIWLRETQSVGGPKKYTRTVWLQLTRRSRADLDAAQRLLDELTVRTVEAPFDIVVHWIVDDLPPAIVAPSCIYRRGSGKV